MERRHTPPCNSPGKREASTRQGVYRSQTFLCTIQSPDLKRGVVVQAVILPAETVAALAPGITLTVKIEDGIPAEHSGFHISNTFCFIKDFFIKSFSVYKTYATAYTLK